MNISGQTTLMVNGRPTRVCGRRFNRALKRGAVDVRLPTGEAVAPSKGLAWGAVARSIRAGKKVLASVK